MQKEELTLGRQIGHVSHLYRRNIDSLIVTESRDCEEPSFTGRNFGILRYLKDHSDRDVFQRDLEEAFKVRRSSVSSMVDRMEQKGMLVRRSVDGDARLKRLELTPKSEQLLLAVSCGVERMENEVRAGFTPEEYRTLTVLLEKLSDIFESREMILHERN